MPVCHVNSADELKLPDTCNAPSIPRLKRAEPDPEPGEVMGVTRSGLRHEIRQ